MAALLLESPTTTESHRLLSPSPGCVNHGFSEKKEARFRCEEPGVWQLFIDDANIPSEIENGCVTWKWVPGFHAGTVRAELIEGGQGACTLYLLDVSPDPSKLGQGLIQEMIKEIQDFDPRLLIGNEPADHGIGHEGRMFDPGIGLARLFQHGGAFLAALHTVECEPQRSTRQSRRLLKPDGLRRADSQTIRASITSGAAFYLNLGSEGMEMGNPPQLYFDVPVPEMTMDNAANRTLSAIVQNVLAFTRRILNYFEDKVGREERDEMNSPLKDRWPRRKALLNKFINELNRCRMRVPLEAVTKLEISAEGLTSVSANPRYANARRLAWSILRPGCSGSIQEVVPWMSPTWHVYEAWCMVRLCVALKTGLPELEWSMFSAGAERFTFKGRSERLCLTLSYQRRFRLSKDPTGAIGFISISDTFIPDLVLAMETAGSSRWYVLDAKYSSTLNSIRREMRSAHVYHDALRWNGKRPEQCWLMVPSIDADADWLSDYHFHQAHGVGIVQFAPGSTFEQKIVGMAREFLLLKP